MGGGAFVAVFICWAIMYAGWAIGSGIREGANRIAQAIERGQR